MQTCPKCHTGELRPQTRYTPKTKVSMTGVGCTNCDYFVKSKKSKSTCGHSRTVTGICLKCKHIAKRGGEPPCDTCVHRNTQCNFEKK